MACSGPHARGVVALIVRRSGVPDRKQLLCAHGCLEEGIAVRCSLEACERRRECDELNSVVQVTCGRSFFCLFFRNILYRK